MFCIDQAALAAKLINGSDANLPHWDGLPQVVMEDCNTSDFRQWHGQI